MEILTSTELRGRLGTAARVRAAVAAGTWTRVVRGCYVEGNPEVTLALRARVAHRVLPAGAVLSDRCLLWVLGVDVLPAGTPRVECVVARGAVVPKRAGFVAREALLAPEDRGYLAGNQVPALRPARAVIDLMRRLDDLEALVVVDAVLRADLCARQELVTELERHRGLRGVERARWALRHGDARPESPPESRVRALLLRAGLRPVPQVVVSTPDGSYRVDLALTDLKIAIEYDGRAVHDQSVAFVKDRRRQNALIAAGWVVLHFADADLRGRESQQALVRSVESAVRQAQARRTA